MPLAPRATRIRGHRPLCLIAFGLALGLALRLAGADDDRLVLLDGRTTGGAITAIDDKGLVHRQAGGAPVDLQGLRRIERPVKPDARKPAPYVVHLLAGGILHARDVTFEGGRFTVRWAYGDKLALPLSAVRAVRLGREPEPKPAEKGAEPAPERAPEGPSAFEAALEDGEAKRDELFAIADDKVHVVRGGLVRITSQEVTFQWNDAERKVARAKVVGVVLAHRDSRPDLTGQCLLRLKDGSALWAGVAKLEGGKLLVRPADAVEMIVPWDAVCRLDVRSTRMTFLSDLDPSDVVQEALVTYAGPWRRDRNVVGGPLQLGNTVYEKGLGVHARCRLTYELGGRYDAFAAVIGLDAGTAGRGDCVFRVEADGKELLSKRMRGADPPAPVKLAVAGAQQLTLAVDWGEDLDLADRANWCDARLLKQGGGK